MLRLLICKDAEQNTLLETRILQETDNINYNIIESPPIIKEREGYIGKYGLDNSGELVVIYEEMHKSETEVLQQRISELEEAIMVLSNTI